MKKYEESYKRIELANGMNYTRFCLSKK